MFMVSRIILLIAILFSLATPGLAAKKSPASQETLNQYMDDLKKNPGDRGLREKIIKLVQAMRKAPTLSEAAERSMARGTAFAQKAADEAGYKKAIAELEAAANAAPWLALAYYNLGVVQEQAELYTDAIQSLRFYLMAAPDAKNAREVKNKIYALEADVEDLIASKNAPAPAPVPAPTDTGAGKALAVGVKSSLEIEPDKELHIIKMPPPDKKSKLPNFIGTWFYKDLLRGEEHVIPAFEISKNANGDLIVIPPKRTADSYANIAVFEINDRNLKLQMKWKMKSVVGYWKNETYELTLSEDGKTLSGSQNQKSIGGRNVDMDRVLMRQ